MGALQQQVHRYSCTSLAIVSAPEKSVFVPVVEVSQQLELPVCRVSPCRISFHNDH